MLRNTILLLIFCSNSLEQTNFNNKYLFELTPGQVMKKFDDVMSDDYIKVLAKEFAAKAAAHFMSEINKQKQALVANFNEVQNVEYEYGSLGSKKKDDERREASQMVDVANEAAADEVKSELDENEAFRLIQEPSPDGDHLDSSGEISHEDNKKIPIIQVTKINGIYFRRLLGMI